ncbi:uncharacterized protein LOC143861716 [Tasmannia lanceolata]|uniref:uncharacterized protein LOC143861716 n=1 Tax=Tasmannia lanceolata TaxID=3420 RepID=UPI0040644701
MATPRETIEEIRSSLLLMPREAYSFRKLSHRPLESSPITSPIHVPNFVMDVILFAEDNEYSSDLNPSIEFVFTSKSIAGIEAQATLLVYNNDMGLSREKITRICSKGLIGEQRTGLSSLVSSISQLCIFSNGYGIRLKEVMCTDSTTTFIIPDWIDESPTLSHIKEIYGFGKTIPTTTLILPLESGIISAVKKQLSSVNTEILLFSKIRKLSVREENDVSNEFCIVSRISLSGESTNVDAGSYIIRLSVEGENECSYYVRRQRFPVKLEDQMDEKIRMKDWVISLAFPLERRINQQADSMGVFTYQPTNIVTNFPFIIQADFLWASRELDFSDKRNRGILNCVASAFHDAFIAMAETMNVGHLFSKLNLFEFLPVQNSLHNEIELVRESIRAKLVSENIMPCEWLPEENCFQKPLEVGRLLPAFREILIKAREEGIYLNKISSHGKYVLHSTLDKAQFNHVMNFLQVEYMSYNWYSQCVERCDLVLCISEDVYLEFLCFLADNWVDGFENCSMKNIPILRYIDQYGRMDLCSIYTAITGPCKIYISADKQYIQWLTQWNREFKCASKYYFMPESVQMALEKFSKKETLCLWMYRFAGIVDVTIRDFSEAILYNVQYSKDAQLVIGFSHFLSHTLSKKYLTEEFVTKLCGGIPVVDKYGKVIVERKKALVPASLSKWVELAFTNLWGGEKYVELGEDYVRPRCFAGESVEENQFLDFLKRCIGAVDIPEACPPDASLLAASSPLSKNNALLLLEWIQNSMIKGIEIPNRFIKSITQGKWLKTCLGYKSPAESFLCGPRWGALVQVGSVLDDIPLIDKNFYGNQIDVYVNELERLGVVSEVEECCLFVAHRVMSVAATTTLTKDQVLSLLRFIRYLVQEKMASREILRSFREEKWLKTSQGCRAPVGSLLCSQEWEAFQQISELPFVDEEYYGEDIQYYRDELKLLGVVMRFQQRYELITENFKFPISLSTLSGKSGILILECIRHSQASSGFMKMIRERKWMRTNHGYLSPHESYLYNFEWGCLLELVNVPLIDESFYGSSIRLFKEELGLAGVVVTFDGACQKASRHIKSILSSPCFTEDTAILLLECCKQLRNNSHLLCGELMDSISNEKWLKTCFGFKSPRESALFDSEWEPISKIADLPFVDETHYRGIIRSYRDELKSFGVLVEFRKSFQLVATGLKFPKLKNDMTAVIVIALLECIRYQLTESSVQSLPDDFLRGIRKKQWMKTHMGYRSPAACFLYDSEWESVLQRDDAPFIDEAFYGDDIVSYWNELSAIGVRIRVGSGCRLISSCLHCHTDFPAIVRIYQYLQKFNWEPDEKSDCWIWIPGDSSEVGEWTNSRDCVLYEEEYISSSARPKVLERYYEKTLLPFFSTALGVRSHPS